MRGHRTPTEDGLGDPAVVNPFSCSRVGGAGGFTAVSRPIRLYQLVSDVLNTVAIITRSSSSATTAGHRMGAKHFRAIGLQTVQDQAPCAVSSIVDVGAAPAFTTRS